MYSYFKWLEKAPCKPITFNVDICKWATLIVKLHIAHLNNKLLVDPPLEHMLGDWNLKLYLERSVLTPCQIKCTILSLEIFHMCKQEN